MSEKHGRLVEKKTLITAAGQGIGRATAELWAAEGAEVISSDDSVFTTDQTHAIDGGWSI